MKYQVQASITISMHVEVEAESEEQAPMMSLCYQCASGEPGEWCTAGEFDGEPEIERVSPCS